MTTPTSSSAFSAHISKFAYSPTKAGGVGTPRTKSSPRQANENNNDPITTVKGEQTDDLILSPSPRKKRKVEDKAEAVEEECQLSSVITVRSSHSKQPSPGKKAKKVPRGYASPDVYRHLEDVSDHLTISSISDIRRLSIIFCGINPGKTSSIKGHHFAHPSNKFWKALYMGGFTDRLYRPEEDGELPGTFGIGLTNLVNRPTSEQSELSSAEMKMNVPSLLEKIERHRPRMVCFVGKKIWDMFESVVKRSAKTSGGSKRGTGGSSERGVVQEVIKVKRESAVELIEVGPNLIYSAQSENGKLMPGMPQKHRVTSDSGSATPTAFDWDRPQRCKLTHTDNHGTNDTDSATLFWVVPSTSGLERTPREKQWVHFSNLKTWTTRLENGQVDLGCFEEIDRQAVERVVEDMKSKQNA